MYYIQRNGKTNLDINLYVKERPRIPSPEYKYDKQEIPGRDGELYTEYETVEDITIPVILKFHCNPSKWQDMFRKAKRWLLSKIDNMLILSDDINYFYKVKHITINESEREVKEFGEFTVNFICEGCQYSIEGQKEITASNLYNDGYITHPIYKVEGEGECTLTVNGKAVKANVGQNLTIDTDRMLAYRTDGTMQNTSLTGDYEDLYLIEGENKVSITSGFVLKIIPNWRYL